MDVHVAERVVLDLAGVEGYLSRKRESKNLMKIIFLKLNPSLNLLLLHFRDFPFFLNLRVVIQQIVVIVNIPVELQPLHHQKLVNQVFRLLGV